MINIPGFYILCSDRQSRLGGGAAIYVRNGLEANIADKPSLVFPHAKMLIVGIYKSSDIDDTNKFGRIFLQI